MRVKKRILAAIAAVTKTKTVNPNTVRRGLDGNFSTAGLVLQNKTLHLKQT